MVRIKWSDFSKYQPINVIIEPLSAEFYIDDKYILTNANFDMGEYGGMKSFELSIPYDKFKKALIQLPHNEQMLFRQQGKIKFKLTKLDWGRVKLDNVSKC